MCARSWHHLASSVFAYGTGGNGQSPVELADTDLTLSPEGERCIAATVEPGGHIGV
jgi:hypothetical protein